MSRSLLVTFDDPEHLGREYDEHLSEGRAYVSGEHEVQVDERCEVVLVHPATGDTLEVAADVTAVDERGVTLALVVTPLVENQLRNFAGRRSGGPANVQQRVRQIDGPARRRLALGGNLDERVALERAFGKEVWEPLLQNPRLTVGEVSRLARKGTMPGPLLDKIVSHRAWVRVPQIRRALLANPRLDSSQVMRVLRQTPEAELKLVPQQTTYPLSVRSAAKKLLGKR